jgi:molybdopterin-guanine dinucleotide biosynthesis protein A
MNRNTRETVGVVLAGGASRRMGQDKTGLRLRGQSLVERAAATLGAAVSEVVVADRGRQLLAGYPSMDDAPGSPGDAPTRGPAAGILGAALARRGRPLLVLACDLPRVTTRLLDLLLARATATGADLVLPRSAHGLEPLVAWYGPAALDRLARLGPTAGPHRLAADGDLVVSILSLATAEMLVDAGLPGDTFANVNVPADAAALGLVLPPD